MIIPVSESITVRNWKVSPHVSPILLTDIRWRTSQNAKRNKCFFSYLTWSMPSRNKIYYHIIMRLGMIYIHNIFFTNKTRTPHLNWWGHPRRLINYFFFVSHPSVLWIDFFSPLLKLPQGLSECLGFWSGCMASNSQS